MKKIYIYIASLVIVLVLLAIKLTLTNKEGIDKKDFEMGSNLYEQLQNKIVKIESKVIDLTSSNDLKNVDEFKILLNENKERLTLSLIYQFLADTNNSRIHKEILIYSLNEITLDDYCEVFEYSISLYKEKEVGDDIVMTIIYPGNDWRCMLVKNYKDKRIRKIMKDNMKLVSDELNEVFDIVLSGIMWMSIEEQRNL
ncbi:MAG TPA: hypothetical protein VKX35_02385 [Fermentimonas sp.]|nr:hypothetical protein [Fermentimonas sp.]